MKQKNTNTSTIKNNRGINIICLIIGILAMIVGILTLLGVITIVTPLRGLVPIIVGAIISVWTFKSIRN